MTTVMPVEGSPVPVADRLRAVVERGVPALLAMSGAQAAAPRAPGKWSPCEIVGHLVDSASNNHRRFLLARWQEDLVFEGYDQDAWVAAHQYSMTPWPELVDLWRAVNLHVARVMAATPEEVRRRAHTRHSLDCVALRAVPAGEPATLEYLMDDYVDHALHHLRQVLGAGWGADILA